MTQELTPVSKPSQSTETTQKPESTEETEGSLLKNLAYFNLDETLQPGDYAKLFKKEAKKHERLEKEKNTLEANTSFFHRFGSNSFIDTNKRAQSYLTRKSESKMSSSDSLLEVNELDYLQDLRMKSLEASLEYYKALNNELMRQNEHLAGSVQVLEERVQVLEERVQVLEDEKEKHTQSNTSLQK